MPNHVKTVCTVTGPEAAVALFEASHFPTGTESPSKPTRRFDFGTIIPVPASIEATSDNVAAAGTFGELWHYALTGYEEPLDAWLQAMMPLASFLDGFGMLPRAVRSREALLAWLEENQPAMRCVGELRVAAVAETGHPTWYQWNTACWGTKWNAYAYEFSSRADGRLVFEFETAWSFPAPIFEKLRERYPQLVFDVAVFDEGSCFAAEGTIGGDNTFVMLSGAELREDTKRRDAIYQRVYGRPHPIYDEDGEEVEQAVPS